MYKTLKFLFFPSILYGMLFALVGVFCSRCKIYDDANVVSISNDCSFIGTSTTNLSMCNNTISNHASGGHLNEGKLKLLVQKPCFKLVMGVFSLVGIIAYSVFANMCYYKLNCEEIHPYIVFVPVSWILITLFIPLQSQINRFLKVITIFVFI